jgi:hypothetical protein
MYSLSTRETRSGNMYWIIIYRDRMTKGFAFSYPRSREKFEKKDKG